MLQLLTSQTPGQLWINFSPVNLPAQVVYDYGVGWPLSPTTTSPAPIHHSYVPCLRRLYFARRSLGGHLQPITGAWRQDTWRRRPPGECSLGTIGHSAGACRQNFERHDTIGVRTCAQKLTVPLRYLVTDRSEAGRRPAASWNFAAARHVEIARTCSNLVAVADRFEAKFHYAILVADLQRAGIWHITHYLDR